MKRFGHFVEFQHPQNSFETLPIKTCQIVKNKNKLPNFEKKIYVLKKTMPHLYSDFSFVAFF
jgi:hypothetical protein